MLHRPELPKTYDPTAVEGPTYQRWLEGGFFSADPSSTGPRWSMVLPPPNVTGSLHMGHALDHTFQDALARMRRMRGYDVLWLPGMDHAGIATQNVVERELAKQGLTRFDLGREGFVERVWQWKQTSGGAILGQMRRLGDSVDWSRRRFTLDEGLARAVRHVFVSLHDQRLLHRRKRIINWCPRCLTALSDIEVEHRETPGELALLRYPLTDGTGAVLVATSRAETMLGDTAVAVHPDDSRYAELVGRTVCLPLMDREIPIVADPAVAEAFGTGAVKVTPAHDPTDYEIAERHGLPAIEVLDEQAKITAAGGRFEGLDRYAARQAVKAALDDIGALDRVEEAPHAVGHCYRCNTEVEPRLSLQWFVDVRPLADKAVAAVRAGRTRFTPQRYENVFFAWMEAIRDWCVSRQLWWGHRIPAWYCPDGHVTVTREDPSACVVCSSDSLEQDPDVLDTWFSSALWPFSTLGWPEQTEDLAAYYPTSVLVTGYDIIFFWVARMLMFGCHFAPPTPFDVVAIHGMVRDAHGRKMSKSAGNVVDPLDLMDRYGADALRLALMRGATPGGDVSVTEEWVEGARNYANKIWNIGRFVLRSIDEVGLSQPEQPGEAATLSDRWLASRLEQTREAVTAAYEAFDLAEVVWLLHAFTWAELADWGVELAKSRLAGGGGDARRAAALLAYALEVSLKLLHPIMPFVTEKLGRALTGAETIMLGPWPAPRPQDRCPAAEADMARIQDVVTAVRRFRAEHGMLASRRPRLTVVVGDAPSAELFQSEAESIHRLAGLAAVEVGFQPVADSAAAKLVAGGVDLHLALDEPIDLETERRRLIRDRARLEEEESRIAARLADPLFVDRAPKTVVTKARTRLEEIHVHLKTVTGRLEDLSATGSRSSD